MAESNTKVSFWHLLWLLPIVSFFVLVSEGVFAVLVALTPLAFIARRSLVEFSLALWLPGVAMALFNLHHSSFFVLLWLYTVGMLIALLGGALEKRRRLALVVLGLYAVGLIGTILRAMHPDWF